jgi:hypothetical protein
VKAQMWCRAIVRIFFWVAICACPISLARERDPLRAVARDKITGVSMGSHQHPPYDYRPFEEFILGKGETTLNSSDVAVAVAGHDGMVAPQNASGSFELKDSRLEARFFSHFDTVLYTDSVTTELIVPNRRQGKLPTRLCCGEANKSLGSSIIGAQYKREHVLDQFLNHFPGRKWYVLTEEDVWWSGRRLLSLLSAVDRAVAKEAIKRGVGIDEVPTFVAGGPDGSVDGPFFIFNRALLAQLAGAEGSSKAKGLGPCRHALVQCKKNPQFREENKKMCRLTERDAKFIKKGKDDAMYNWGHLISFCTHYFRKHQEDMANDVILKFWSIDYIQRQWDALPNFMQNGNTWGDSETLSDGFLAHISDIYKCCGKCKKIQITTEEQAKYVLQQSLRALVCWHHATPSDVKFLDDLARRDDDATNRAISTMLKWSLENHGCNWRGLKNSQHRQRNRQ